MAYSDVMTTGMMARLKVRGERERPSLEGITKQDISIVLANVPGVSPDKDGVPPLDVAAFGSSI